MLSSAPPKRWAAAVQIRSAKAFLVQQHLKLLMGIAAIDLAGGSFMQFPRLTNRAYAGNISIVNGV